MDAIDCQGFAGGMTLGVVQSGFRLVGKRELPGGFGAASCLVNRHLLGDDWTYEESTWEEWTPIDVPFVFGNPPCSGFSLLSHKGFRGPSSPINSCMWALVQYAAKCNPQVVAFESVQGAFKQGRELMRMLRALLDERTGDRWFLYHVLHNGFSVGGAAIRPRYFFLASRIPFGIESPVLDQVPTVHDVLADLMGVENQAQVQPYGDGTQPSWWVDRHELRRDGLVDGCIQLSNTYTQRIKELIELVGWQHTETLSDVSRRAWDEGYGRTKTTPDVLRETLRKWADKDFMLGFNQACRWDPGRACRVVTGAACTHVIHPYENRPLNLREVYRVQGFPDDWLIAPAIGLAGSVNKATMWPGKGIPVQAGEWLGGWVKRAIEGEPGAYQGETLGRYERVIDVTHDWKCHWDAKNHVPVDTCPPAVVKQLEARPA